jgi:CRISPR type III-A-associated RAMP protein Csm4
MKTYKIKIEFKTLPRLGKAGLDDQDTRDHLGADQFFSALSLAWIDVHGLEDFKTSVLDAFLNEHIPWRHSNFFPEDDKEFYLPSPFIKIKNSDRIIEKKDRKPWVKFKSVNKLLSGNQLEKEDYASILKEYSYQSANLQNKEAMPFITTVSGPISDNRRTDEYKEINLSLSGLIDIYNQSILSKFDRTIEYLQDEGLGANRSSGYGQIKKITREEIVLPIVTDANHWITLTDYLPSKNELQKIQMSQNSAYNLISKSGWIYKSGHNPTDQRKSKTFMMSAGSSFDFLPNGVIINVGNDHEPSYRYGLAYPLGVKL